MVGVTRFDDIQTRHAAATPEWLVDQECADDVGWLLDRVTQLEAVAAEAQRYLALDPHVSGKRLAEALADLDHE